MSVFDNDMFFHITLILKTKNRSNPLSDYCDYISCYFTSLSQIYSTLIISDLYLYGTKMFPQFEQYRLANILDVIAHLPFAKW